MTGSESYSVRELATALGISRRKIQRRAAKERWLAEVVNKRGDKRFLVEHLPEDVRMAIVAHSSKLIAHKGELIADRGALAGSSYKGIARSVPVGSPELAGWQNKTALAWADLVRAYVNEKNLAKAKGLKKVAAANLFLKGYNTGMLLPNVFAAIGETSVKSVERQLKKFRDSNYDYAVLAPKWGTNRGHRKVTDDEFNTLLSFALHPNHLRIAEVTKLTKMRLRKQGVESPSHEATLRRAIEDWRKTNDDKWVFCREGEKALNDQWLPYLERDINLLDVGDVLVADGHVLNFQILNPFTGKPGRMTMITWYDWASCMPVGWEIMPTENVQCVAAGLRHAILTLGKMPKIAYLDNGKAFRAKVFTSCDIDFEEAGFYGMFARLGIDTIFAWPYNAQSKPVERFFGTFNELERLMPTYTGASIQDKPAHMMRNEKLHRQIHEKKYGGWVPTIEEANRIITGWVIEYASRPHRGLKGLCPGEIFKSGRGPGVDEIALRHLMMSIDVKKVGRNGVSFRGRSYYDEALYGYRERVTIKYDFEDLSRVHVYDITGARFLCTADALEKVHPMAKLLGTKDDLVLVEDGIKKKRAAKKSTEFEARAYIEDAPALVMIPERVGEIPLLPPLVKGGGGKARLTRGEAERIEAEASAMKVIELKPKRREPVYMSEADRYEDLLERECKGVEMELDDMTFMRYFKGTNLYASLKSRFEFLRELFIAGPEETDVET